MEKKQGIGFFEKYLTIWVALCIVIGIAVGQWLPVIPQTLSKLEYANVSIPVAILIWLMIYPMMLKVDFQSVKNVGKRPRGIIVTCVTNWLIKPFTMFGIAYLFFYVIFKTFIPAELAEEYLAGAVLLGAAPCTATLSFSELEAITHIFDELDGNEGILVASRIADRVGITRSVIVNALRKFESAGVIESRSSGMKGTYIKVVNDVVFDELAELKRKNAK